MSFGDKDNQVTWERVVYQGFSAWKGETPALCILLVPELGSKMVSFLDKESKREWLWTGERSLGNSGFNSAYEESNGSGWDEMFPTINPCVYREGLWHSVNLPDHGEVWSRPWKVKLHDNRLVMSIDGVALPYTLQKSYCFLDERTLDVSYQLTNLSDKPFHFLWAAHPLLHVSPRATILISDESSNITVSYSKNDRLGVFGDIHSWPVTSEGIVLNQMGNPNLDIAEKFYFHPASNSSSITVLEPDTDETFTFRFPLEEVPYLAVWMNRGGYRGEYNLAIEPATGWLDSLAYAVSQDKAAVVSAYGVKKWYLRVKVGRKIV